MIEVIDLSDSRRWDSIVRTFADYDVYYLSGYVRAFELHGDGHPVLIYYSSPGSRAVCVLLIRNLADDPEFAGVLPSGHYYDAVTPYGYGGLLSEGDIDSLDLKTQLMEILRRLDVISVFFRFHPVLGNAGVSRSIVDVVDLGKTIALDLTSPEIIWDNITSKNRNMIRKAGKLGVEIRHGRGKELLDSFRQIYNRTMDHDHADAYYYFDPEFYESIDRDLADNYELFYALYKDEIIAASIMIFANDRLNYHLSGSLLEYRHLAPSNLLLYEAAQWGFSKGMKTFHLGGGLGSGEDSLYKFKAAFNRNSDYRFSIGKLIVDRQKYNELLGHRGFSEQQLGTISYFPAYRAHIND